MPDLMEKIQELPPELRREVHDFVDFLALNNPRENKKNCASIGRAPCERFVTSTPALSFKKKALEWWGD